MASDTPIDVIRDLLAKIGLELAFAIPGTPTGSLRHLLTSLKAALPEAAPQELSASVSTAAASVGGSESVTVDVAERMQAWHAWMEEAVKAWERGQPLPSTRASVALAAERQPAPEDEADGGEPVSVLPEGADPELMRLFCAESADLLNDIEQGVLRLEQTPGDPDTLATVFRAFHTFKGNAAVMKLAVLQRLAHELESLLDAARRGTRPIDRPAIDVILAGADVFSRYVAETIRQLDGHDVGRAIPLPLSGVAARARAVLTRPPQQQPVDPESAPVPVVTSPRDEAPAVATAPVASGSIRVDTLKLDGLVDLVGELVIAQSMVARGAEARGVDEQLARSLGQLRGITADLQRTAMALRMVPIRGAFQKMSRLVRDLTVQLSKEIRLVVEGEETELDRTVIEEIGDPLLHMVRNAADHGIEPPDARAATGKPRFGTISLRARHQGGFVIIEIGDDGRGLDPARIRDTAVARGLIAADAPLDDRETLDLIFAPGFSTAESVSDLSGRGVGMDVVRRNIERIRGTVDIESRPGAGTTFTIALPLTLAIIDGLLVAVGDQRFVIPAVSVRESFRPRPGSVSTVHGRGELVDVRGRLMPLVRLGARLGIEARADDPAGGIVVVVEAGHDCRCLLVDELVGKQEVVIKGLGETFQGRHAFAGAAILGDGRIGLILDTAALVRLPMHPTETAA